MRPVKSAESLASAGQTSARSSGCLEPPSPPSPQVRSVQPPGHNRSVSHDSYFDTLAETPQHGQEQTNSQLLQEEDEERKCFISIMIYYFIHKLVLPCPLTNHNFPVIITFFN